MIRHLNGTSIETSERGISGTPDWTGAVRVLHHAAIKPVFGLGIIEELSRHGYRLGPGTIYPLLRSLERRGSLESEVSHTEGGRRRICYTATRAGRIALDAARSKVKELCRELFSPEK